MITMTTIHHPSIHTHNHIIIINVLGKYSNLSNKSTAFIFLKHLGSSQTTNQTKIHCALWIKVVVIFVLFCFWWHVFSFGVYLDFFFYSWCSNFFPSFSLSTEEFFFWPYGISAFNLWAFFRSLLRSFNDDHEKISFWMKIFTHFFSSAKKTQNKTKKFIM